MPMPTRLLSTNCAINYRVQRWRSPGTLAPRYYLVPVKPSAEGDPHFAHISPNMPASSVLFIYASRHSRLRRRLCKTGLHALEQAIVVQYLHE